MQGGSSYFSPFHPIFPWNQFVQNVFKNQKVKDNQFSTHWPTNLSLIAGHFCCSREIRSGCLKLQVPWRECNHCWQCTELFYVQGRNWRTSCQFMSPKRGGQWISITVTPHSVGACLVLGKNFKLNFSWIAFPSFSFTLLSK